MLDIPTRNRSIQSEEDVLGAKLKLFWRKGTMNVLCVTLYPLRYIDIPLFGGIQWSVAEDIPDVIKKINDGEEIGLFIIERSMKSIDDGLDLARELWDIGFNVLVVCVNDEADGIPRVNSVDPLKVRQAIRKALERNAAV